MKSIRDPSPEAEYMANRNMINIDILRNFNKTKLFDNKLNQK